VAEGDESAANGREADDAVRQELERVLASRVFARSQRISRFLRYTVEQSLLGQRNQLKESVIGVEVYDRAGDYNPKIDPIVRNEARRLRAKLREYYEREGRNNPIRIDLPTGSYAPIFQETNPRLRGLPQRQWLVVAGVILLAALALTFFAVRPPLRHLGRNTRESGPISIAVLPFINVSPDPANEYFSDGLTEELINALAKVPGLRVPARTSAFAFKGKQQDIRGIGAKLNVSMVLEGSVRKDGDTLRVTVQLNNTADGYQLWSETYDRQVRDTLQIQSDIAHDIATALRLTLVNRGEGKERAANAETYTLYLKGRYFLNEPNAESWQKAVVYFGEAAAKDLRYANAYAGLSDAWYRVGYFDPAQPQEAFREAEAAARKAIELDDQLAEAHTSLAKIRSEKWEWAGAEQEFKRAIELNPNYAEAHRGYAVSCLMLTGRLDQAVQEARRAEELDPVSPFVIGHLGMILFVARHYEQASEQVRKLLEIDPNNFGAHTLMARIYAQRGMLAEASAEFDRADSIGQQHSYWRARLAGPYTKAGNRATAERLLEQWKGLSTREIGYAEAMVMLHAGFGNKDEAFRRLETAYRVHSNRLPWIKVEPEYDDLRSDPRFHALLRKMGLE
jgi:serine/threonine-protein kinase